MCVTVCVCVWMCVCDIKQTIWRHATLNRWGKRRNREAGSKQCDKPRRRWRLLLYPPQTHTRTHTRIVSCGTHTSCCQWQGKHAAWQATMLPATKCQVRPAKRVNISFSCKQSKLTKKGAKWNYTKASMYAWLGKGGCTSLTVYVCVCVRVNAALAPLHCTHSLYAGAWRRSLKECAAIKSHCFCFATFPRWAQKLSNCTWMKMKTKPWKHEPKQPQLRRLNPNQPKD